MSGNPMGFKHGYRAAAGKGDKEVKSLFEGTAACFCVIGMGGLEQSVVFCGLVKISDCERRG